MNAEGDIMNVALYEDIGAEFRKEKEFLKTELLISTDIDSNNIDEIFDFSRNEMFPFSLYYSELMAGNIPYDTEGTINYVQYHKRNTLSFTCYGTELEIETEPFANTRYKNMISSYKTGKNMKIEGVLKFNCIISALYTLLYIRDKNKYTNYLRVLFEDDRDKTNEDYNQARNNYDAAYNKKNYFDRYCLLKKNGGKREISVFNKALTRFLILNHQYDTKNNLCESKSIRIDNTLEKMQEALELYEVKRQDPEKYRIKYDTNRTLKKHLTNLTNHLKAIEINWKFVGSKTEQIIFYYSKERIFHNTTFLFFFENFEEISEYYNMESIEYLDFLKNVIDTPLVSGWDIIFENYPYDLIKCTQFISTVSVPILLRSFFITFVSSNNENKDKCINQLISYIDREYDEDDIKTYMAAAIHKWGPMAEEEKRDNYSIIDDLNKGEKIRLAKDILSCYDGDRTQLQMSYEPRKRLKNFQEDRSLNCKMKVARDYYSYCIESGNMDEIPKNYLVNKGFSHILENYEKILNENAKD